MARGFQKTPEEIEAEKLLQAERYPEQVNQANIDPTQALRNLIKSSIAKTNTPLGRSLQEEPKQEFEMSPEIKRYGYNLFGMDQIAPSDVQAPSPIEQEPVEEIQQRSPAAIESPEIEQQAVPALEKAPAKQEVQAQPADIEKMIQQATEEEDRAALWKQSAKLRDAVMGAGSGTILKTDTSLYEDLEKRAQRPIKNLLLRQELDDKQAKNNPNSEISKLARESLDKLGMNMSGFDNVSYSQLEKLYPSLTQALYTKIVADSRRDASEQSRLDRQMIKEARADEKSQKAATLSDKQITPINDVDTIIANVDNILGLVSKKEAKGFVGPVDAKVPDMFVGAEEAAFRSSVGRMSDAYRKAITGAGASVMELQKLESRLPNPSDNYNQFVAKAREFRKELIRNRNTYLNTLKKQGKNVSEFQTPETTQEELTPEERLKKYEEMINRANELRNKRGN